MGRKPVLRPKGGGGRSGAGLSGPGPDGELKAGPPGYFALSKSWWASFVFLLPLLALYEVGALAMGADTNAMAHVAKLGLFLFRDWAAVVFNSVVMCVIVWSLFKLARNDALRWTVFPVMLAEAVFWGVVLAPLVQWIYTGQMEAPALPGDLSRLWRKAVAAAGAGVYEELLFRGGILTLMWRICRDVLKMAKWAAPIVAVLAAALVFSAFHFVDPAVTSWWAVVGWSWRLFYIRFLAGTLLGALFAWRGLGIVAYAHATFNILVFCA